MTRYLSAIRLRYSYLIGAFIAVASLIVWVPTTHAVDGASPATDSVAMSPAMQQFDAKAGTTVTGKFTVINDGQTAFKFIVYGRPYSVTNEQYEPQFEKTTATTDLYQWVKFDKVSYSLAAGERLDIPYEMAVPATASPGGHYGVIFAETQPDAVTSSSVLRKKRVGSIVSVNVDGSVLRKGTFLSSSALFWQPTPPLSASNRVENTGNTDFPATVATNVEDLFGSVKYSERKEYVVYPSTIRNITFNWDKSPWFGLFKAKQTVTVLNKSTTTSHYILMAPRWLALVLIIVIAMGAWYGLLRYKRR
jgi:hypothetical protein